MIVRTMPELHHGVQQQSQGLHLRVVAPVVRQKRRGTASGAETGGHPALYGPLWRYEGVL